MNKKLFTLLVILMSLSLIGIIFVQAYYINNALESKEEQFTFNVKKALTYTTNQVADIEYKKNSIVPGGLYEISKNDEKKLDVYEEYPTLYKKYYFYYYRKKVMTYVMVKKSAFRFPTERYLNIIKRGYKDCNLDKRYLNKALLF